MAATPTLLTRRGRQRDTRARAQTAHVKPCLRRGGYVCTRIRVYVRSYASRVIKIVCGIKDEIALYNRGFERDFQ